MTEDARDARSMMLSLFVGGMILVAAGIGLAVFAEPISGEDGADTLAAVGYLIAALAGPAVTVAVVAYAVSLGVRASR